MWNDHWCKSATKRCRVLAKKPERVLQAARARGVHIIPRKVPFVSHDEGTELVIQHIEKYWCPSVLSKDLLP
jgi:hypothetical protein